MSPELSRLFTSGVSWYHSSEMLPLSHMVSLLVIALAELVLAHTIITYPGWRGNNLITNDSFPFGMQWMYPCKTSRPSDVLTCLRPTHLT